MNTKKLGMLVFTGVLIVGMVLIRQNLKAEEQNNSIPLGSLENVFSAYCSKVFDGDTIVVRDASSSRRKVRLVGIDTPEIKHGKKEARYGAYAAKSFTTSCCLHKTVYLDIDDEKPRDKYGRTLALVYLNQEDARKGEYYSLNAVLLREGYAKILYIPPSEFNPYSWSRK